MLWTALAWNIWLVLIWLTLTQHAAAGQILKHGAISLSPDNNLPDTLFTISGYDVCWMAGFDALETVLECRLKLLGLRANWMVEVDGLSWMLSRVLENNCGGLGVCLGLLGL